MTSSPSIGHQLRTLSILGSGTALLAASLALLIFIPHLRQRAISRPILDLASLAAAVSSEKDYSVRAPTVHSAAEIEQLTFTFNQMLSEIESQNAQIQEAQAMLERRVVDRTR